MKKRIKISINSNKQNVDQSLQVAELLSQFRTEIKTISQQKEIDQKKILQACDLLRDEQLVKFGFLIEDGVQTVVKQINYQEYLINKQREELLKIEKLQQKQKLNEEKQKKLELEKELAKIPAEKMFLNEKEYCEFDQNGIPVKMVVDGQQVEVPKSKSKKLQKEWEQRKKLNEKYAE
uniref:Cysteinyl-tRNA synthetase n=1 Tax=Trepomonas sp. PC1 TaxID=1076344 RepID=A0A146K5B0_9EUKA|eukprot:JAP91045.1 Cysteinyl-tRNA synthetase [Trepomonas sp. PC1]